MKKLRTFTAIILCVTIICTALISIAILLPSSISGHVLSAAIAPSAAIQDMMQVQQNNLQDFRVIQSAWIDSRRQVVLFRYTVPGQNTHEEFGIATVEMRVGWSAYPGNLLGLAPAPSPISYSSIKIQDRTILYGILNNGGAHTVRIILDTGTVQQQKRITDGFIFVFEGDADISQIDVIDESGNTVFTSQDPELNTTARWW